MTNDARDAAVRDREIPQSIRPLYHPAALKSRTPDSCLPQETGHCRRELFRVREHVAHSLVSVSRQGKSPCEFRKCRFPSIGRCREIRHFLLGTSFLSVPDVLLAGSGCTRVHCTRCVLARMRAHWSTCESVVEWLSSGTGDRQIVIINFMPICFNLSSCLPFVDFGGREERKGGGGRGVQTLFSFSQFFKQSRE